MNKQTKVWLVLSIALSLLVLSSACGGGGDQKAGTGNTNATAEAGPYSGPTGTISGVISFNGTPPAPKKIDTTADPVCGQKSPNLMTDDVMIKDGKVANTFVYIKEGTVQGGKKIGDYAWATPTSEVQLDQNGCHYAPHVLGVMVNQKLKITNSDATQHNIHPTPKLNQEWNQTQPNGAPPGKYTVIAWREGQTPEEKPMEVTVTANGSAKADFSFGAAATSSIKPSLQMMPAIEFPMLGKH